MPKSPAHSAGKCSVCFCRAGMCSVAQQCTLAFAGMLKGAALPESWFQCSFRCFFHPFLWSCCHSSMFVYDQLGSNETNTAAQLIPAVCGVSCSDKRLKKPLQFLSVSLRYEVVRKQAEKSCLDLNVSDSTRRTVCRECSFYQQQLLLEKVKEASKTLNQMEPIWIAGRAHGIQWRRVLVSVIPLSFQASSCFIFTQQASNSLGS